MPSTPEERDAFRAQLMSRVPRWYSPWVHVIFPSLFGLAVLVLCATALRDLAPRELLAVPAVFVLSNMAEWHIHRDVLHTRRWGLTQLYDRHTPQHHRVFVTGDMAVRSPREFRLVLIPFYGIVATVALDLPLFAALWLIGQRNVALLFLATAAAYVVSYELMHLSYHLPEDSAIGRLAIVRVLRRHHATHHAPARMQRWNFNVTVPLWDWVRGTVYRGTTGAHVGERAG